MMIPNDLYAIYENIDFSLVFIGFSKDAGWMIQHDLFDIYENIDFSLVFIGFSKDDGWMMIYIILDFLSHWGWGGDAGLSQRVRGIRID